MKKSGYKAARNEYFLWCAKMFFDLVSLIVIFYFMFYAVANDAESLYRFRFIVSTSIVAMFYIHAITYKNFADSRTKYYFYKSAMNAYTFNVDNHDEIIECIREHEYKSLEYKADVMNLISAGDEDTFFSIGGKIHKNISEGVYEDEIGFIKPMLESTSYIIKYIDEDFLKKTFLKDK